MCLVTFSRAILCLTVSKIFVLKWYSQYFKHLGDISY